MKTLQNTIEFWSENSPTFSLIDVYENDTTIMIFSQTESKGYPLYRLIVEDKRNPNWDSYSTYDLTHAQNIVNLIKIGMG